MEKLKFLKIVLHRSSIDDWIICKLCKHIYFEHQRDLSEHTDKVHNLPSTSTAAMAGSKNRFKAAENESAPDRSSTQQSSVPMGNATHAGGRSGKRSRVVALAKNVKPTVSDDDDEADEPYKKSRIMTLVDLKKGKSKTSSKTTQSDSDEDWSNSEEYTIPPIKAKASAKGKANLRNKNKPNSDATTKADKTGNGDGNSTTEANQNQLNTAPIMNAETNSASIKPKGKEEPYKKPIIMTLTDLKKKRSEGKRKQSSDSSDLDEDLPLVHRTRGKGKAPMKKKNNSANIKKAQSSKPGKAKQNASTDDNVIPLWSDNGHVLTADIQISRPIDNVERRRIIAEAAEKRQQDVLGRGLQDVNGYRRKLQNQEELEKRRDETLRKAFGKESKTPLKWQV